MNRSPFPIRGVIEGFYGPFYTFPERNDLIRFIGQHGYNFYIYGPKNDRQHRSRWWERYPDEIMSQFAQTILLAQEVGVTFCYAISPISYVPEQDFARLTTKLHSLYDCGVRSFSILMDDIACTLHNAVNCKRCHDYGRIHAEMSNQIFAWLQTLDPDCTLSMCPTLYHGTAPFNAYLHDLGMLLDPAIDIFYTGPEVCSPTIARTDAEDFAQAVQRKPLIWDNYPVNDLDMQSNMHIGPIRGRGTALHDAVKGIVVNTMLQAEASKIPLLTFADYMAQPDRYDACGSWERALREVGGETNFAALSAFADNSLDSCLCQNEPSRLTSLADATLAALHQGVAYEDSEAVRQLTFYLNSLDEACYSLKHRMSNLRLRDNLLPWIVALEDWIWLGKHALAVLELLPTGRPYEQHVRSVKDSLNQIARHSKQVAGDRLLPLALYALEQAEHQRMRRTQPMIELPLPYLDLLDLERSVLAMDSAHMSGIPVH
jgi:hyaluronoglucosaminidase